MTKPLSGLEIARQIGEQFPDAVTGFDETAIFVQSEALLKVARYLKESLDLDYLTSITAVDFFDHVELVYHLASIEKNYSVVLKTRCEKDKKMDSVVGLWQGADLQEREVYDLMGIPFEGHPNLKRLFLWEGFQGHPLRKDYTLDVPGGGKTE